MTCLVDSSVWIDFLRHGEPETPQLASALRDGAVALNEVVWLELCSGARGKREEAYLEEIRQVCQWLAVDGPVWELGYSLRRAARRKGLNCPLADVLIVATGLRYDVELIHRDRHLDDLIELSRKREHGR